ncbi:MAG: hypothetical protein WHV63_11570 [Ignavibacteria bacterium]
MDKEIINKIIEILGKESSLKIACGISRRGPIDLELDKNKIERARMFEIVKPDSLELTEMGKIFVAKTIFDYTDNMVDSDDEDDDKEKLDDDEDWEDDENDDDDDEDEEEFWEDEDWEEDDDEDEDFDDWEEWEEDEDEDDDDYFSPGRKRRRK